MSSTKSPKYIPDTPHGEDFFAVHSQIAEMLNKTIVEEDVTKQSFTFGLLGSWGSGKSLTIGKLRDKLANESNILFIEFDVWKYVDTSLYRSILIDFESALKTKTGIPASYKNGIATSEGENLTEILYKSRQTMTPEVKKHDNKLLNLISEWEKTWYGKVGSFLFLRSANMFRVCGKYFLSRSELFYFLIVISFVFSCLYYYRSNLEAAYPTLTDTFLRPIFKFIAITCLGFSAVELFREAFKDFFKEMLPKTNNNIIITSPPTFAQDQFEIIFRGVIEDIAKNSGKKFVIVFDNIDRCESNVTIQILTGLKTFLDQKNCFYVIPCDDLRIKNHLKASNRAEDDYLDKIFQAFIRIPQIEGDDKVTFIEKCLAKADFELSKNDELKISQILTLAYKADTPRQIKRFFNDFISYYRLADVVDPQKRFLLKDISLFTLMIAIKQKWPELENFILNNSNFFEEQETFKGNTSIPSDAYQFVERCAGWIDHSIDPAIFIYLKNSNSSGNRIQKIFIEKVSDFVLNSALISQMERYLNNLVATGKYILFEDGIQRLKEIIEAQPTTLDTHILEEVFKLYFRMLSKHNTFTYDNKKQSFFITHAKFIANNVDQIKKLERNQIAPIERQICQAIRSAGANAEMKELYNSIKESFAITNLRLIFNQINYDEFIRLQQLTLLTPSDKLSKLVSNVDLESIANSISFNRDESPFMQFLSYGKEVQEYSKAKQITAAKVNESLSQITSHAAPHQYDPYIISGLKNLLPEHWTGNHKSNFNSYINTRLSVLFQHGHIDLAVKYSIEAIRNGAPSVDTYFAPNGQQNLNLQQNFNSLADQIDEAALLTAMNTPNLRGHFLRLANGYNLQQKILSKVPTAFYDNSLNTLYDGNLQMLVNLLTEIQTRATRNGQPDRATQYERTIITDYGTQNPALLYENSASIIPLIKDQNNLNTYLEASINNLKTNSKGNADSMGAIVSAFTDNDVIRRVYDQSKMQFMEVDHSGIFVSLLGKLQGRDKEDYIERILIKCLNDLKTPGLSKNILSAIADHITTDELLNKQRYVLDLIKELFETSRGEDDHRLGIKIAQKLKGNSSSRQLGLDDQINKIISNEGKSPELKTELNALL